MIVIYYLGECNRTLHIDEGADLNLTDSWGVHVSESPWASELKKVVCCFGTSPLPNTAKTKMQRTLDLDLRVDAALFNKAIQDARYLGEPISCSATANRILRQALLYE